MLLWKSKSAQFFSVIFWFLLPRLRLYGIIISTIYRNLSFAFTKNSRCLSPKWQRGTQSDCMRLMRLKVYSMNLEWAFVTAIQILAVLCHRTMVFSWWFSQKCGEKVGYYVFEENNGIKSSWTWNETTCSFQVGCVFVPLYACFTQLVPSLLTNINKWYIICVGKIWCKVIPKNQNKSACCGGI